MAEPWLLRMLPLETPHPRQSGKTPRGCAATAVSARCPLAGQSSKGFKPRAPTPALSSSREGPRE